MLLFSNASNLDYEGWLRGILSAGISGGASAITGGMVVTGMDPEHYNFQAGKFYVMVGALFAASFVVSVAKFLQGSPLPPVKTVTTTTVQKVTRAEDAKPEVTTVTKVQETHTEPINQTTNHPADAQAKHSVESSNN